MMSLPKKHGNKVNVDYKARLEHKLYLARENPEPIFDVSECALKNVPSGIYSLCKVFRKKVLWMHNNKLTSLSGGGALSDLSLLVVLDIHGNEFTNLPSDIMCLSSLKELYLQDNNIRKLPNEIVYLSKLTTLNVAKNNLKQLPEAIEAELSRDISSEDMQTVYHNKNNDVQEHRQNALLEVEKTIRQQQEYEIGIQSVLKEHRKKLLKDLAIQQTQLEQELEKVQQERDSNRARLLSYIYNAEKEADNVIKEFLSHSEAERQTQTELVEREKQEEMQILSSCHSEQFLFRTKDTLLSMEKLLEEELHRTRKLEEYSKYRDYTAQSLLTLEVRNNDHLAQIVQNQEKNRQNLIDTLRQDEVLQKAAVAALLERSDTRCWSIVQQVNLVQSQLAALTNIELERRKLEINQQLNEIAEKRVALSVILVSLLEQQQNRRDQLLETINNIEQQRYISDSRRRSQFWLMQYQSLMEARPQGLLEMLEPTLVRHVAIAGALHCLPFLASLPSLLPNLSDEQLESIGIHCENDRIAIRLAVENYMAEVKIHEFGTPATPSAPPDEACTSSDSQEHNTMQCINTAECVICFDQQCEVIFLPCGHLCCCSSCANMISSDCPMCRSIIERKIHVVKP
ncbi:E3 ubiquitin-protein ligase LRSAM1 isoform X4 [Halictus rubicundus]|uniref:E3 ubiquitin-protein ligase LRSAM1 isoform X4 n=1 Tax=Halictus rubicundus TaxID=77578 RepID=UPI0040366D9B